MRSRGSSMLGWVFVATVSLALPAFAQTAQAQAAQPAQPRVRRPSKAEVRLLLSGYEDVPSAATWQRLGPETLATLVSLYDDASEQPFVRLRAVSVAMHYPTPATRTFLLAVARAPQQSDLFVREAVLSLGAAFGAGAVDDIRPFLSSRDVIVREGTALALARIGGDRAHAALRARLPAERAPHVREAITRALGAH